MWVLPCSGHPKRNKEASHWSAFCQSPRQPHSVWEDPWESSPHRATVGTQGRPGTIASGSLPLLGKEKEATHTKWCQQAGTPYTVTTYICLLSNTYQLTNYPEYFLHPVAKFWTNVAILKLLCHLAPFIAWPCSVLPEVNNSILHRKVDSSNNLITSSYNDRGKLAEEACYQSGVLVSSNYV